MLYLLLTLLLLLAALAVYVYGFIAAPLNGGPSTALAVSENETELDRAIAPLLKAQPGKSGLCLLADNLHAFALRAAAARHAERSLDLQYYYWKDDLTGSLLAHEVIKAADRGVRVRLLIDDINSRGGGDRNYLGLDRHPHIEVRLFNPTRCRGSAFLRGVEMLLRFWSVNRRMHNKAWIADGRLAMVGGRNIGDAYFDAAKEANFRDMDVAAVGPVVAEAAAVFDSYWNSAFVFPIKALNASRGADLAGLRQRCEAAVQSARAQQYVEHMSDDSTIADMRAGVWRLHWTGKASIVSDPPEKAGGQQSDGWLRKLILSTLLSATRSLDVTSPYFIPRESGTQAFAKLAASGVEVSVLTNSLAATDVAAVHGGYTRYREQLLRAGVKLFELKVRATGERMSLFGSKGASLHTKAFVVDGVTGFVGSFNFDPRSVALNTEMGLLFEHEELAEEMLAIFAEETSPERAYRVILAGRRIAWEDAGRRPLIEREPDASLRRRLVARTISLLPIEFAALRRVLKRVAFYGIQDSHCCRFVIHCG